MEHIRAHVLICAGTGCVSSGSKKVEAAFREELVKKGLDKEVKIIETGCHGFCEMGPLVIIYPEGTFYVRVQESDVPELVENHLYKGRIVERLLFKEPITHEKIPSYNEIDFYKKQMRMVLANCGHINPEDVNEYIAEGGYEALGKVLKKLKSPG